MSDAEPTKPTTRVEISAGAHQVVIEAAGSLHFVARKALELWAATETPSIGRGYAALGFHTELAVEVPFIEEEPGGIESAGDPGV